MRLVVGILSDVAVSRQSNRLVQTYINAVVEHVSSTANGPLQAAVLHAKSNINAKTSFSITASPLLTDQGAILQQIEVACAAGSGHLDTSAHLAVNERIVQLAQCSTSPIAAILISSGQLLDSDGLEPDKTVLQTLSNNLASIATHSTSFCILCPLRTPTMMAVCEDALKLDRDVLFKNRDYVLQCNDYVICKGLSVDAIFAPNIAQPTSSLSAHPLPAAAAGPQSVGNGAPAATTVPLPSYDKGHAWQGTCFLNSTLSFEFQATLQTSANMVLPTVVHAWKSMKSTIHAQLDDNRQLVLQSLAAVAVVDIHAGTNPKLKAALHSLVQSFKAGTILLLKTDDKQLLLKMGLHDPNRHDAAASKREKLTIVLVPMSKSKIMHKYLMSQQLQQRQQQQRQVQQASKQA
eukprot:TRINITY_DN12458_c1_g1_i10.p1 TRINITY_DN12458_c1_g1~~TRINITY_DN12458_c1_g1_i10.p1  ORF type:complete len:406 (+),score=97.51 TRINITY_DN12458_c1_g1_i10:142-1359(+)